MDNEEVVEQEIVVPDYKTEIAKIVKTNYAPKVMMDKVLSYHESDIAEALPLLTREERNKLYSVLDIDTLTTIFEYAENLEEYFAELSLKKKIGILSNLEVEIAASYLKQLGKTERQNLIEMIDDEARREIALINSFDEDEIGSKMSTNYIAINHKLDIKQAMKELVNQAAENDNISTLYVLDDTKTYCGAIDLKDLILARENTKLIDITTEAYPYVNAHEQIEECMERLKNYSEDSIPVLDDNNKLIGVITAQDFVQVLDDEMGDDYAKLAGLSSEEDLNEPIFTSTKKRIPWLIVLLLLGMLVSTVVGMFEGVVAQLTIIVAFQSLVLGMAGNVGTQSLAVTIRVLMDEQLTGKQRLKLVFKEVRVGFVNGTIIGILSFIFLGIYVMLVKQQPPIFSFAVSGCVGGALLIAMVFSSFAGTMVPLIFKKLKIDPAVASGPLITTINDLVAVIAYYGFAFIFLIQVMQLA
ncbi:MAG: magnesium transporter [Clostridia bacterium]|nr:magnesium transporter [Clostridia bacterium]